MGFPRGHRKTTTLVAGLRTTGMVAPMVLDGPINGDWFEAYVVQVLVPGLRPGRRRHHGHPIEPQSGFGPQTHRSCWRNAAFPAATQSRLRSDQEGLLLPEGHALEDRRADRNRHRDRAVFYLAIDSKLTGCDLVKLQIGGVVSGGHIRNRASVIQQKTGRPVRFEIMTETRTTLQR